MFSEISLPRSLHYVLCVFQTIVCLFVVFLFVILLSSDFPFDIFTTLFIIFFYIKFVERPYFYLPLGGGAVASIVVFGSFNCALKTGTSSALCW